MVKDNTTLVTRAEDFIDYYLEPPEILPAEKIAFTGITEESGIQGDYLLVDASIYYDGSNKHVIDTVYKDTLVGMSTTDYESWSLTEIPVLWDSPVSACSEMDGNMYHFIAYPISGSGEYPGQFVEIYYRTDLVSDYSMGDEPVYHPTNAYFFNPILGWGSNVNESAEVELSPVQNACGMFYESYNQPEPTYFTTSIRPGVSFVKENRKVGYNPGKVEVVSYYYKQTGTAGDGEGILSTKKYPMNTPFSVLMADAYAYRDANPGYTEGYKIVVGQNETYFNPNNPGYEEDLSWFYDFENGKMKDVVIGKTVEITVFISKSA